MANSTVWDPKALNERFVYRRKKAEVRLEECQSKARQNAAYEALADEAAAIFSIYSYVESRSFLASHEQFRAALQELATFPAPTLTVFDQERFQAYRIRAIRGLENEVAVGNEAR